MRIAIDAHSVGTGLGGNESYATNLIEALAEVDQINQYVIYVTTREAQQRFGNRWPNFSVRTTLPHTPLVRVPVTLSVELRRRPVDLLHVQFTAPPLVPTALVASIHDLSFEHLPHTFRLHSRAQLRLTVRRTARRANRILALSEHTRRDIIDTYKISPHRVTTVPIAASNYFRPVEDYNELQRVRHTYGIKGDYLLSVGSIQPRKNLDRLVAAYARLRNLRPKSRLPQLVLVGKRAWLYQETIRAVKEINADDSIVVAGYVPQRDLPALYSGALCFVYPSFFEGFGLPPLEAMNCGTPVIVGDRTSLPEVVGEAGILVDPFDVEAITAAIVRLIDDPEFRTRLSAKGLNQARAFDWQQTARRTLVVYQEAVREALHFSLKKPAPVI